MFRGLINGVAALEMSREMIETVAAAARPRYQEREVSNTQSSRHTHNGVFEDVGANSAKGSQDRPDRVSVTHSVDVLVSVFRTVEDLRVEPAA